MIKCQAKFVGLLLFVIGCSSASEPTPPRPQVSANQNFGSADPLNGNSGSQNNGSTSTTPGVPTDCNNTSNAGSISGSTSGNTSLSLLAAVTYESKIKSLISIHCSGCHGNPTDGKPNLSTWSGVQSRSSRIVSTSGSGDIIHSSHNGIKLSSQDKADFEAWAQGGYLELSSSTGSSTSSPNSGSTGSSDNCAKANESLLKPQKMIDCNNQGFVFDREANITKPLAEQTCTSFKLGNWCTDDGIVAQFGNSGSAVRTRMADLKSQGFQIDQCGEDGSARFVYMVKEEQRDGNPQLKIYKLRPSQ